jgi:hypothetical protein
MSTYAFADVHGMYSLWQAIKNYIAEDDHVFFLGDAADRGPDGIKIIQELLADPRMTYMKGNHEELLFNACSGECRKDWMMSKYADIWLYNGGYDTAEAFLKLSNQEQDDILLAIERMPERLIYPSKSGKQILLSHAGFTPGLSDSELIEIGRRNAYIWDRKHIHDKWPGGKWDNYLVVHGHTPCQILDKQRLGCRLGSTEGVAALQYSDGYKIDIDLGCFSSKKIALLNLDTLEVIYFTEKGKN